MPKLTRLALAPGFAAMLLGFALFFEVWPGLLPGAVPVTSTPALAVVSSLVDAHAGSPTPAPTPSDSAPATPWLPSATPSLLPTATQPSPAAMPSLPPQRATEPAGFLPAAQLTADESILLVMVNDERTRAGLPPLLLDPVLQAIAHGRAADMIARSFYSHIDPATGQLAAKAMLLNLGVRYSTSENFFSGPYNAGFVGRSMQWLMGDAVHRTNILLRFWNTVGVGVAGTPGGLAVVTQEFGAK